MRNTARTTDCCGFAGCGTHRGGPGAGGADRPVGQAIASQYLAPSSARSTMP